MNIVTLVGNLGNDPEVKSTQSGEIVTTFSLATKGLKDKTDWHKIVCFGKLAGVAGGNLFKGSTVAVSGMLTYNTWEKDGKKITQAQIIANRLDFISKKKDDGSKDVPF